MAPHSRILAWKIPGTEEPGRLQSLVSLWVRHDWAASLSLFTFMHWRRKWQPTPVFLPGEAQGWWSLVGCRLWGLTESDTTEVTQQQQQQQQSISGFPKFACQCSRWRDPGLIPKSGRFPGVGNGNPLQYSCLENPGDRGAWRATVHEVAQRRHDWSDFACSVPLR